MIKELYFPDSIEVRTQNNYTYKANGDNKGDVTFYLTFVHKATTSDDMMIALRWEGGIHPINIFVREDKLVVPENPLIDEPTTTTTTTIFIVLILASKKVTTLKEIKSEFRVLAAWNNHKG